MNLTQSLSKLFASPKMLALLLLGFASGLPYNLTRDTLSAWMTSEQVDLTEIGYFTTLTNAPASFKFLWAPILDRFIPPFLGRRRGWIVLMQLLLIGAIAVMALQQPKQAAQLLAVNAVILAFFSVTQDIAGDAYRTDVLAKPEVGFGAAVWVIGYRIALLVTGSLALIWAPSLGWRGVYGLMAGLMTVGVITAILAPEPQMEDELGQTYSAPDTFKSAVVEPFTDFFTRLTPPKGMLVLLFILLYKLGDQLAATMTTPFLIKTGFTLQEVGAIRGGMGLVATLVGGIIGGTVLSRIGINRSLWIFGALQAVSNFMYYLLAIAGKNDPLMVMAVNVENFCGGLGTSAFLGFLMNLCNPRFSATQYALFSSLTGVARDIIAAPSGDVATRTGWPTFFFLTFLAALPGLALLPIFAPWNARSTLEE